MTRRTSQSMRRSVGDLRVCRVRSDLAEALPLRARRQQQAPNSDGRGYGAAFNAARDQLLANKPMCAKGCGTLADTAQHNPSAGRYGRSGRRQHRVPRDALLLVPGGRDRCTGGGPYVKVRRARRAVDGPSNTRPIGALPASTLQRVLVAVLLQTFVSPNSRIIRHTDTRAVAEPI